MSTAFDCSRLLSGCLFAVLMLLGACKPPTNTPETPPPIPLLTGDLPQLRTNGQLRILVQRIDPRVLQRPDCPLSRQRRLAAAAAASLGLQAHFIELDTRSDLIPALLEGRGDLISANLPITASSSRIIDFTLPIDQIHEMLISGATSSPPQTLTSLKNREIAVQRSTAFYETALALQETIPGLHLRLLPPELTREQILDLVSNRSIDITLQNSNFLRSALAGRADIHVIWTLPPRRSIAWGLRPDSPQLLGALNRFLYRHNLSNPEPERCTGDLPSLQQRGVLRLITRHNASTHFIWRGELLGFEYELASQFAEMHHMRLEVVIADEHRNMLPMLLDGEGDLIGAFWAQTPERAAQAVSFSRPYHYASELLIARTGSCINNISDLNGRTVSVRRSSSYWNTLCELRRTSGINFLIQAVPEDIETEEIIARTAAGTYDLTVADSHILDLELTWRDDIESCFPLGNPIPHNWVVRQQNTKLLAAINAFIQQEYRGYFYNTTYNKYFGNAQQLRQLKQDDLLSHETGQLSPYDDIIRKYARQYDFDWRLIASQMYQESRFDPHAISLSGAAGLMQLKPYTAFEMGVRDSFAPEPGIRGGVKYLSTLYNRFEETLDPQQKIWMALAAYNIGLSHVQDARQLAAEQGLNPNVWFDQVEQAILLLSTPKYARSARHGYCRGEDATHYVQNIRKRYEGYCQTVKE